MSFTVWVYATDFNVHHNNNLNNDTFETLDEAIKSGKKQLKEIAYDTAWAKVIDNSIAGKMGDSGVFCFLNKGKGNRIYPSEIRYGYKYPKGV